MTGTLYLQNHQVRNVLHRSRFRDRDDNLLFQGRCLSLEVGNYITSSAFPRPFHRSTADKSASTQGQ